MEAIIRFLGLDDVSPASKKAGESVDDLSKKVTQSNKNIVQSNKEAGKSARDRGDDDRNSEEQIKRTTKAQEDLSLSVRKFSRDLREVSRFAVGASAAVVGAFSASFKSAQKDIPAVDSALKDLINSFQVLANNLATIALPTLQEFTSFIRGLVSAISGFAQRNSEFVNSFLKFSAITLALSIVGVGIAKFIKALVSLGSILVGLLQFVGILVTKFGFWGLAITAITLIFIKFKDQILDFLKKIPGVGKVVEGLESKFKDVFGGIDKIIKDFQEGTTANLQRTQDAFGSFAKGVKSAFNSLNENSTQFGQSIGQSLETAFGESIFQAITGRIHGLKDILLAFRDDVARAFSKTLANEFLGSIFGDKEGTKKGLGGIFTSIGKLFGFGKGANTTSPVEVLKQETDKVAKKFTGLAHNMDQFGRAKDRLMDNFNRFSRQMERQDSISNRSNFGSKEFPGLSGPFIPAPGAGPTISPVSSEAIQSANEMATAMGGISAGAKDASLSILGIGDSYLQTAVKFVASTAISLGASIVALSAAVAAGTAAAAVLAAAWIPAAVAASIATFGGAAAAGGSAVTAAIGTNQAFAVSSAQLARSQASITFAPGSLGGLPKGAKGAIVRRPTLAIIGEEGDEAVVPLSGTQGNSPLGSIGGGGQTSIGINVNIDKAILSDPSNIDSFVEKLSSRLAYLSDKGIKRTRTANA